MSILVDATVLSNFAAVGRLDLLASLLGTAFIASAVHGEVIKGRERGYAFMADVESEIDAGPSGGWLQVVEFETEEERRLVRSLPRKLHDGEAMSLAIASVRGWTFLTDDLAARNAARRLGVPIGGTIGVLRGLVQAGTLSADAGNDLLRRMIDEAGFHSPVTEI